MRSDPAIRGAGSGIRSDRNQPLHCSALPISRSGRKLVTRTPDPGSRAHAASVPTYIYDADTPRLLTTPEALRLREDCRRAAITRVRSASSRRCAGTIEAGRRNRSCARRERWRRRGVRELLLISQDTTFYGIDRGERGALGRLLARIERRSKGSTGFDCSTSTRPPLLTTCWMRWQNAKRSAATSTCRCSMRRPRVLKRMRRPGNRKTYDALLNASATACLASRCARH